ncbi:MAG TPA: translation initiation factor IF-2 [Spirochaetota bacterium]|jgi:translation initiation factor IF-2|nr:MAG: Translation initiation factor IF-2 [Spirochaetes bacterium ADurb.Bin133]HNZ27267.1 translation initiation factor IF-2 [Spirochaetota bacterium]HPY88559.1 translation initiation factor IF-2 [Spirochaetota bacterium]
MSNNEMKGELIKKKEVTPKKVVVVKKVKKVIIKKHPNQKENETGTTQLTEKTKESVINEASNVNNQTQTGIKKADVKIDDKKDNATPLKTNATQTTEKKKYFTKKYVGGGGAANAFIKKNEFQNRDTRTGAGGFNRPSSTKPIAEPLQKNDKDRSRKKLNQKKYDTASKNSYKEEIQKGFLYKKKEKDLLLSVPESIDIIDVISISDLAKKMNLKANSIISKLMDLGMMVTINDKIDSDTASIVASEYNCKVNVVSLYEETIIEDDVEKEEDIEKRPPVVTIMGHVDHGKTKLLDAIRTTDVALGESGGITQHIGAYTVALENGETITFIDTPGHEAFSMMRARGAEVTDIVVLVVAADDGVMPQTVEAIKHAKLANAPIIVAINKVDKPNTNIEKIKQQLTEHDLLPEEWGGSTLYCEVSALKKLGIKELLETIILQAEMMDLKSSKKSRATGFVLESKIDHGKGVVATVLISKGALKVGDFFVAGIYSGKARALYNDKGEKIKVAYPSMPVEITGLEYVPNAGDPFNVTVNEKEAKVIAAKRQELNKMEEAKLVKKVTLNELITQKKEGEVQEIKIIIKADVHGSAQAIQDSLEKLSNKEIKLVTVSAGVGAINKDDVMLAVATNAFIIGFHVRPNPTAQAIAEQEKVEIKRYNIIYDVIEDIKSAMQGMIKPDLLEELIGTAEIKQVFKISKIGTVAGCIVSHGKIKRNSLIRLIRDDVVIYSGKITTLKRFKDDVSEVVEGVECGIGIENYKDFKVGDVMEAYEIKEIARKLDDIELA